MGQTAIECRKCGTFLYGCTPGEASLAWREHVEQEHADTTENGAAHD